MEYINILRYWDELASIVFLLVVLIKGKKKNSIRLYIVAIAVVIIGLLGNFVFKFQSNSTAIMLDIVANLKVPICCYGFYLLTNKINTANVLHKLRPFASIFIYTGFLLCFISMIVDIGMRGQQRLGLWGFNFIYKYAHVFSSMLLACLVIVDYAVARKRKRGILIAMGMIQLILTLKGASIVAVCSFVIISIVLNHRKKIKAWHIILMIIAGTLAGTYQINEYFLENAKAPRAMLLMFGFRTMIKCFPIGSGFATFASDMANKYYSGLYRLYGFNLNWGTREGSEFLNDSWWPIIMAQFGVVGLIVVVLIFYKLFKRIQSVKVDGRKKIMIMTAFFYLMIASLGTSIFTTSVTIILIFSMILVVNALSHETDNEVIKV